MDSGLWDNRHWGTLSNQPKPNTTGYAMKLNIKRIKRYQYLIQVDNKELELPCTRNMLLDMNRVLHSLKAFNLTEEQILAAKKYIEKRVKQIQDIPVNKPIKLHAVIIQPKHKRV